ncbi:molecular chaperone [Escherichia coli]|nr:molecular chaperone [Escherichia coli]
MKFFLIIVTSLFSLVSLSHASVSLGGTRVIYNEGKRDASIIVYSTSDETSPYLIQSFIDNDGEKGNLKSTEKLPFIVTPPLFRLEPGKENTLRIVKTGGDLPNDRESVFWLNVKAIPGIDKKNRTENSLKLTLKNRVKLFYRPASILTNKKNEKTFEDVRFIKSGSALIVDNPTPYYISFSQLKVGGKKVVTDFVMTPPKGKAHYPLPHDSSGVDVEWSTITDYGSVSEIRKGILNG